VVAVCCDATLEGIVIAKRVCCQQIRAGVDESRLASVPSSVVLYFESSFWLVIFDVNLEGPNSRNVFSKAIWIAAARLAYRKHEQGETGTGNVQP